MTSIVRNFCYSFRDEAVITQAEDKAKEQGKSFSTYLVHLIKKDLSENKPGNNLPILNFDSIPRQTTINEYDIGLFQPSEERLAKLQNLSKEQQTKVGIDVLNLKRQLEFVRKY
jgi:hypothetical protein